VTPELLSAQLSSLDVAADVVDAIDNKEIQKRHGWDLSGWSYELIPWGVRFTFQKVGAEVVVVATWNRNPSFGQGDPHFQNWRRRRFRA